MHKKSLQKKSYFFNLYLSFLIILTMVAGGLGGYFIQTRLSASKSHKLAMEINRLNDVLVSRKLSGDQVSVIPQPQDTALKSSAEEIELKRAVENDIKFDACKHVTNFRYENWYPSLKESAISYGVDLSDCASACFSEDSGLLVFLVPSYEMCQPADIYRFDINTNKLSKAYFISDTEECLGAMGQFGKREGNVIRLKGYGERGDCRWSDNFDYDFVLNTLELKNRVGNCQ